MTNADKEWLASLKEGDEVIVAGAQNGMSVSSVQKLTATQLVVRGTRYNRKDGWERGGGGSFSRRWLRKPSPEVVAAIKRKELINRLSCVSRSHLETISNEKLKQAAELLGL
jgi:hypothetical protein